MEATVANRDRKLSAYEPVRTLARSLRLLADRPISPLNASGEETVRSKGDDDEDDNADSAFCRALPAFALCHRPLHHRVTERFPGESGPARP